jgi:hypothetical protein
VNAALSAPSFSSAMEQNADWMFAFTGFRLSQEQEHSPLWADLGR